MSYSSEAGARGANGATVEMKQNLAHLREDASKFAGSVSSVAKDTIREGREKLDTVKEAAAIRAQTLFSSVEDEVRARPAAALGVTLGAGLLLGLVLAGRRRH